MVGFVARTALVAGTLVIGLSATPALADCYENIGCTDSDYYDVDDLVELSCENLWLVRNRIYDENGFCFKTKRARQQFDNANCYVDEPGDVNLSKVEQHNVDEIVQAEEENGC